MTDTTCKKDTDCPNGSRCTPTNDYTSTGITAAASLVSTALVVTYLVKSGRRRAAVLYTVAVVVFLAVLVVVWAKRRASTCKPGDPTTCPNSGDVYYTECKKCLKRCRDDTFIDCATGLCVDRKSDDACLPQFDRVSGQPLGPIAVASSDGRTCTGDWKTGHTGALNAACRNAPCTAPACVAANQSSFDRFDINEQRCVVSCKPPAFVTHAFEIPLCDGIDPYSDLHGACGHVSASSLATACRYDSNGCDQGFVATGNGQCVSAGVIVPVAKPGCRASNVSTTFIGGLVCAVGQVTEDLQFIQTEPAYALAPTANGRKLVMNVGAKFTGSESKRPHALRYAIFPVADGTNEISQRTLIGEYRNGDGAIVFGDDNVVYFVIELDDVPIGDLRVGLFGLDDAGHVTTAMSGSSDHAQYGAPLVVIQIQSAEPNVAQLAKLAPGQRAADLWNSVAWSASSVGRLVFTNLYGAPPSGANPFGSVKVFATHSVVMFPGMLGEKPAGQLRWNEVAVVFAMNVASSANTRPHVSMFDGKAVVDLELTKGADWDIVAGGVMWIVVRRVVGQGTMFLVGAFSGNAASWITSDQRSPLVAVRYTPMSYDATTCADMRALKNTWTDAGAPMLRSSTDVPGGWCVATSNADTNLAQSYYCLVTQDGKRATVMDTPTESILMGDKQTFVWKDGKCRAVNRNEAPTFVIPGVREPTGGEVQSLKPFDMKATVDFSGEQCLQGAPLSFGLRCGAVARAGEVLASDVPLFNTDDGQGPVLSSDDVKTTITNAEAYAKRNGLPMPVVNEDHGLLHLYQCDYEKNSQFRPLVSAAPKTGWPWRDIGNGRFPTRYMARADLAWLPAADDANTSMKRYCCVDTTNLTPDIKWTNEAGKGACHCPPALSDFPYLFPDHCAWGTMRAKDPSKWNNQTKLDEMNNISISRTKCAYDILHPEAPPVCSQA